MGESESFLYGEYDSRRSAFSSSGQIEKKPPFNQNKQIFSCLTSCSFTQVVSEVVGGEEDTTDNSLQDVDTAAVDAPRWTTLFLKLDFTLEVSPSEETNSTEHFQ